MRQACRRAARRLTVTPETFDVQIESKTVTNGADLDLLKRKYAKTFTAVVLPATRFILSDMPKEGPASWSMFMELTLVRCRSLIEVDLMYNETITCTLTPFAGLDVLEELWLKNCASIYGTLEPLAGLSKLWRCSLAGCVKLEGTLVPLSGLSCSVNDFPRHSFPNILRLGPCRRPLSQLRASWLLTWWLGNILIGLLVDWIFVVWFLFCSLTLLECVLARWLLDVSFHAVFGIYYCLATALGNCALLQNVDCFFLLNFPAEM